MTSSSTYYTILGASENMTQEEISKIYKNRVRIFHPDRFDQVKQPKDWEYANRMLQELNEAYEYIKRHHTQKTTSNDSTKNQSDQNASENSKTSSDYSNHQGGQSKRKSYDSENEKQGKNSDKKESDWASQYRAVWRGAPASKGLRVKAYDTKYIGTIDDFYDEETLNVIFTNSSTGEVYRRKTYKNTELLTVDNKKVRVVKRYQAEDSSRNEAPVNEVYSTGASAYAGNTNNDDRVSDIFVNYLNANKPSDKTFGEMVLMFCKSVLYGVALMSLFYLGVNIFRMARFFWT